MTPEVDYDALKKRGFLRQKQDGFFLLRTRMGPGGIYTAKQISTLVGIAEKYGNGTLHGSTRQGLEIPFIRHENIDKVENKAARAEVSIGTSGPRMRTTTACPGTKWCKSALMETSSLSERIEKELGIRCGMDLPHKFKIAISGCPNKCTRAEASEIGIHGQVGIRDPKKRIGYAVYLGGCGGRTPRLGHKLEKVFTQDEVLGIIGRVVDFYRKNAKPRQRLALLIEEIGLEAFLKEIL